MQSRDLNIPENKELSIKSKSVSEKLARCGNVAVIATMAFLPWDHKMHRAYTNPTDNSIIAKPVFLKKLLSSRSWAQISAGSIYAGIKKIPQLGENIPQLGINNLTGSTTKITLKNASEVTTGKDTIKSKEESSYRQEDTYTEEGDEASVKLKTKSIFFLGDYIFSIMGVSFLFGILETLATQSNAVKSVHLNQAIALRSQNLTYVMPCWSPGIKGRISRTKEAFAPRALKNGATLVAYPATELYKKYYEEKGLEANQAKWMAIGTTATTFGIFNNGCNVIFTNQILSRSTTLTTINSLIAKNGKKVFFRGAGTSMLQTGFANWIIPEIENVVDNTLLPAEKKAVQTFKKANVALAKSHSDQDETLYEVVKQNVKALLGLTLFKPMTKQAQEEIDKELDFCPFSLS
jgi:hypothetical protein